MIDKIVIYSDGTLCCFDGDDCMIPTASGTWNLIPTIISWMLEQYPSSLPDECRTAGAKVYFACRAKGSERRLQIPSTHFIKLKDIFDTIKNN